MASESSGAFTADPRVRTSFDVGEVGASVECALEIWARDESVETVEDVSGLLSRGTINVYSVRTAPLSSVIAERAAETAIDDYIARWDEKYGSQSEVEPPCPPFAYRNCLEAIEDAFETLSKNLTVKTYEAVEAVDVPVARVVEILKARGVIR